jgi:hypothetical protein
MIALTPFKIAKRRACRRRETCENLTFRQKKTTVSNALLVVLFQTQYGQTKHIVG